MKKCSRLLLLGVFTVGGMLADQLTGWITDQKCAQAGNFAGDQHKKCVESGQAIVFVNDADSKIYTVNNPEKFKSFIGKKVNLTGEAKGDKLEAENATEAR